MSQIVFKMDLSTAGKELDRLFKGPGVRTIAEFESLLAGGLMDAQMRAHIETGSLRESLSIDSSYTDDVWQGTLNSIHHGIFELWRGGSHYYHEGIKNEYMTHDRMIETIKGWFANLWVG